MLAIFCVTVGVLVIVALQLVGMMINGALLDNVREFNGGDLAVHSDAGLSAQQLSYLATLKAQGAITAYTASAVSGATTTTASGAQHFDFFTVNPAAYPLAGAVHLLTPSGGALSALLDGNSVVITNTLRDRLGAHVGDTLDITTDDGRIGALTIAGVMTTSGPISARAELLMSEQGYQALVSFSHAPIRYTWVWVNVPGHSDARAAVVAEQIRQHVPQVTTTTVPQAQADAKTEITAIRTVLQVVGLLALLIGGVGIVNTMQVLLRQRQLEIAMLKTQGYQRRDLLLMFGLEACLIGLIGGVVGALAGIGMSLLVRSLVERAFSLTLPTSLDLGIVASGVEIGLASTLIFGLLPILRASAIRPLAVLRERVERGGWRGVLSSVGGLGLLGVLYFLLSVGILGNAVVALVVVGGAGLLLGLLTAAFAALAWLLSHLPVPDALRWWWLPLLGLPSLLALGVSWRAPSFGVPLLALVLCWLFVACLPRAARASVRLALRNIGRAKVRSATTLVALFVGVFAIGLGLILGQGLKGALAQLNATHNRYNAYILASSADGPVVAQRLAQIPGLANEDITVAVPDRIVAINGRDINGDLSPGAGSGDVGAGDATATISGLDGVNLTTGQLPPVTLAQGALDTTSGRLLGQSDAGTTNAELPLAYAQAPFNLKLGDRLTVSSLDGTTSLTLQVVGFYQGGGTFASFAAVLVDRSVVNVLSEGHPYYVYAFHLDPARVSATLSQVKQTIPGIVTLSDAAQLQQLNALLDNIVQVVEAIASLTGVAGLVLIANAVALAMLERRRELGILKAIGHTSRSVLAMVVVENSLIGMAAAFVALLFVALIAAVIGQFALKSTAATTLAPALVLALVGATAGVCMLIAALVAWRATRIRPLEVLRYE
jgi:predicted lysophospholipase L1 biosynthesis ABC-type transport system permease subunit